METVRAQEISLSKHSVKYVLYDKTRIVDEPSCRVQPSLLSSRTAA